MLIAAKIGNYLRMVAPERDKGDMRMIKEAFELYQHDIAAMHGDDDAMLALFTDQSGAFLDIRDDERVVFVIIPPQNVTDHVYRELKQGDDAESLMSVFNGDDEALNSSRDYIARLVHRGMMRKNSYTEAEKI